MCSRSIAATLVLSLATEEPLRHPLPSRSLCAFHCRRYQGAIMPYLTIKEPSRHSLPLPSRRHCAVPCSQGAVAPSLAIKEPLRHPLPSPSMSHRAVPRRGGAVCHPLPSKSRCTESCHQGAAIRLVVSSLRFSRCHLPSAGTSASHHAVIASCHAPLGPLVQLVKASPLLTPPPHISGIIESSKWSV